MGRNARLGLLAFPPRPVRELEQAQEDLELEWGVMRNWWELIYESQLRSRAFSRYWKKVLFILLIF
jgi:hypothetical protein